jgi:hypothetical protein
MTTPSCACTDQLIPIIKHKNGVVIRPKRKQMCSKLREVYEVKDIITWLIQCFADTPPEEVGFSTDSANLMKL